MRIRFENSIEDFAALARFHYDHSSAARRTRVRAMWILAITSLAFIGSFALTLFNKWQQRKGGLDELLFKSGILCGGLVAVAIALIRLPKGLRKQAVLNTLQMYSEGHNKAVLGPRELELIGEELVSRSTYVESKIRLEAVERVASDNDYTYIYVSATHAYIIPHDAVLEGDPERFAEVLTERIAPNDPYHSQ